MVKDIKELEALVKMLRKHNVDIIKIGDVEIVLGKSPEPVRRKRTTIRQQDTEVIGNIDENTQIPVEPLTIPTDELTDEQKMFGSSDPSVWENQQ